MTNPCCTKDYPSGTSWVYLPSTRVLFEAVGSNIQTGSLPCHIWYFVTILYLQISFSLFKRGIVLFGQLPLQSQEHWKVHFQDFDFDNFLRVGGWRLMPQDPLGTHILITCNSSYGRQSRRLSKKPGIYPSYFKVGFHGCLQYTMQLG